MATQPQFEPQPRNRPSMPTGADAGSPAKLASLRKKLIRRAQPDHSQVIRRSTQFAFLLWNVWIGGAFYLWVRHFEAGTHDRSLNRPAGVEGWLPIAGMMNLKYWFATGRVPAAHPAAMFLFIAFLAIAFLFRKAFCSWLCPVGTLSESLWRIGRKFLHGNFQLPRWIDIPLRALKYVLLGFFVWAVANMSAGAVEEFMQSPYGAIADVRMLNFFRGIGPTAAVVIALLAVSSLLVKNFWCRYLCPYGALLGLTSLLSPFRIRRSKSACIDCAKCVKACPSSLPVDQLISIKSAECTGCMECVAVCPSEGALEMALPRWARAPHDGHLPAWAMGAGIAVLFFGIVGYAKTAGYWDGNLPDYVYRQLVPQANAIEHPAE